MSKMKIEIRKPQYLAGKESVAEVSEETGGKKTPFIFQLLMVATYMLSALAIWFVYQKYSAHS